MLGKIPRLSSNRLKGNKALPPGTVHHWREKVTIASRQQQQYQCEATTSYQVGNLLNITRRQMHTIVNPTRSLNSLKCLSSIHNSFCNDHVLSQSKPFLLPYIRYKSISSKNNKSNANNKKGKSAGGALNAPDNKKRQQKIRQFTNNSNDGKEPQSKIGEAAESDNHKNDHDNKHEDNHSNDDKNKGFLHIQLNEQQRQLAAAASANSRIVAEKVEQGIKKVAKDLHIGDQLAMILVATFVLLIPVAPYVIRQMRKSSSTYHDLADTDDPIDDFTKLVRQEWQVVDDDGSKKSPVELMLHDVMQSKALQDAALDFVLQIFEAPEFKASLNRLVMQLWTDLVNDPETTNQVINLLQVAIQDPRVQKAAQELVLNLSNDDQVKQALVEMLQRIGVEDQVLLSTQALLTSATHRTLNDNEILEHSMEFASDVVGDDSLQQTAREALWNTFGTAFRPALTIFLTASGIGLFILGVVCVGFARSSEQEVQLLEQAARSLYTNSFYGIFRLATWPHRTLHSACKTFLGILFAPVLVLHRATVQGTTAFYTTLIQYGSAILGLPGQIVSGIVRYILSTTKLVFSSTLQTTNAVSNGITTTISSVIAAIQQMIVSILSGAKNTASKSTASTASAVTQVGNSILWSLDRIRMFLLQWLHLI